MGFLWELLSPPKDMLVRRIGSSNIPAGVSAVTVWRLVQVVLCLSTDACWDRHWPKDMYALGKHEWRKCMHWWMYSTVHLLYHHGKCFINLRWSKKHMSSLTCSSIYSSWLFWYEFCRYQSSVEYNGTSWHAAFGPQSAKKKKKKFGKLIDQPNQLSKH